MARSARLLGHRLSGEIRVVYLTNQLPLPAHSGGQVRESQILTRLVSNVRLELFVLTEYFDRDLHNLNAMMPFCAMVYLFESTVSTIDGRFRLPDRVLRYQSAEFDACLKNLLLRSPPDLLHIEGYFLVSHVPHHSPCPIFLVEENIEYLIDRECNDNCNDNDEFQYAGWRITRAIEESAWRRATRVGAVAKRDAQLMEKHLLRRSVDFVPNGCDHVAVRAPRIHVGTGSRVVFVGNYSWVPTRLGAIRLIREIWPDVIARFPEARLTLVGAGLDSTILQLIEAADGISAAVGVDSVVPFLLSADVFVSPISSGYGSKLKMIEALRTACVIVCCPESLRGLPITAKQAVMVAQSSEFFAERIATVLKGPELRSELAMKAAHVAAELPTWDDAAEGVLRSWRHTIEKGSGSSLFL